MKNITLLFCFIIPFLPIYSQTAEEFQDMCLDKIEKGDYQYAMVLIDKAIRLNDTFDDYYLIKAEIQSRITDTRDAIDIARNAVRVNPLSSANNNELGIYFYLSGELDSAIYWIDKAINLAEDDTARYNYIGNKAMAYMSFRDYENGLKYFEETLAFNPNHINALSNLGVLYIYGKAYSKAISVYKKLIKLDSSFSSSYMNLGLIYSELDSFEKSLFYFDKIKEVEKDNALLYSNRGYTYYKIGEYEKAIIDINHSINLISHNSYAYRNLALVYLAINNKKRACEALEYAYYYGFEDLYGNEVNKLLKKHCKRKGKKK